VIYIYDTKQVFVSDPPAIKGWIIRAGEHNGQSACWYEHVNTQEISLDVPNNIIKF